MALSLAVAVNAQLVKRITWSNGPLVSFESPDALHLRTIKTELACNAY